MSKLPILQLVKQYSKIELLKASLTGLLFVLLYAGIILPATIMISMLYIPYMVYFLLFIYIALSLAFSRGLSIVMETLQTYEHHNDIAYTTIKQRVNVGIAIIIFIIESIIYLTYLQ